MRRTILTFWMLLFYIVAALVWWFISLERQNRQMMEKDIANIYPPSGAVPSVQYLQKVADIKKTAHRNTTKYVAEGITFFALIVFAGLVVYRSIRQQFKSQQQQQNFMMAVTHEFKTPIAVTKLNLETLQKYNLDADKQKKIIQTTLDETARLNFLTNNILVSSQLENQRYNTSPEELNLSALTKDCIEEFSRRFADRKFAQQIEDDTDIKGDALLLQMLINNLLENAIKYSPKETTVTTTLIKSNNNIILTIKDEGTGIADAEKKKVFDKFYRIGNEATRKAQGTGLGLYLCHKIAEAHNADISVTDNAPQGCIFVVEFKS